MNTTPRDNEDLTFMERTPEWYMEGLPDSIAKRTESDVFVGAKLSRLTQKVMERYYAKKAQKKASLRNRKPTRAKGRYHHNRKKKTQRETYKRRWRDNPFGCLIYGYGAYSIDKALWERYITPLWEQHDPSHLKVVRYKKDLGGSPLGTKENPYTIYDFKVVHSTKGVVYDGQSQKLFDLSSNTPA